MKEKNSAEQLVNQTNSVKFKSKFKKNNKGKHIVLQFKKLFEKKLNLEIQNLKT